MNDIAELLESVAELPLADSLSQVITALKGRQLVAPLGAEPEPGKPLQMMVANDNQGQAWLYVYTSPEALRAAAINAPAANWIAFDEIISAISGPAYGGLFIDAHDARRKYLIPAEYFPAIAAYLAE